MNRARNFPPSPSFAAMAVTLATQLADLECAPDQSDEGIAPFSDAFDATEKALTRKPVESIGDLLLKLEILAQIAEHSTVDAEEWQAVASDVRALNGPGMAFLPETWLRRWTNRSGGYVRTETGISFVASVPRSGQQRLLLAELSRAEGHKAVADVIDGIEPAKAQTWEDARANFERVTAALPEEASDTELDAFWAAWDDAMLCEADSIGAAQWKLGQLLHWSEECGAFEGEKLAKYEAALFADVARHARKGGVA